MKVWRVFLTIPDSPRLDRGAHLMTPVLGWTIA